MEDKTVPWWSPTGVEMRPRPTEYPDEPTEIVSSDEWMGKAGYLNLVTIGDRVLHGYRYGRDRLGVRRQRIGQPPSGG